MKSSLILKAMACSALLLPLQAKSQQEAQAQYLHEIENWLNMKAQEKVAMGPITIDSIAENQQSIRLFANSNCSYFPFREEDVEEIYKKIRQLIPNYNTRQTIQLITDGQPIEQLIPDIYLNKKKEKTFRPGKAQTPPLITRTSSSYIPKKGLSNRHIALWQSHGWYFEQKLQRWEWQRARLMQTVEDLYTQSFVLPYLVPMLENAGANVLIPRERDYRNEEIIIDNDGCRNSCSIYSEYAKDMKWVTGKEKGFAFLRDSYVHTENPFTEGSYREIQSIRKGKESLAEWIPDIPEQGEYAVYISYHSLPNSTEDAHYTVYHQGGVSTFRVNQKMGGGTWIYLGSFPFNKGKDRRYRITLSNKSEKEGYTITADAVKLGGGMGNIARQSQTEKGGMPVTSGYPRFCEAARYWMQWAGIPDSVYSESKGANDYTDDYKSRGLWVNFLAGGSPANPDEKGLNIPIDLAFAFHSDAGTTDNDSIIGTLGIYCAKSEDEQYADGTSRQQARELTDIIQSEIIQDIRKLYEPRWTRRGMWNKPYFEAKTPRVPTMLLELLSHQNLADMKYGLDPRFQFTVSRAIYKGMLRFLSHQYHTDYVVQPLPVKHMAIEIKQANEIELTWEPTADPLEPTAKAEKYIVYTRMGSGAFDNGTLVKENRYHTTIPSGTVCSYKVVAVNQGGKSFPSEILSAGYAPESADLPILIINGFDRICAPSDFLLYDNKNRCYAGFTDHGVPYINNINYTGAMKEFRRDLPWIDDDAPGFGESYGNYETKVIAGNTFDYPSLHGEAILKAGYSFVSCSNKAVESGTVNLNNYSTVDLILGKELQTKMGSGTDSLQFKTFSSQMQTILTAHCKRGGNLFVSGAYVGSDLWSNPHTPSKEADRLFACNILKYQWRTDKAACTGKVRKEQNSPKESSYSFTFSTQPNRECYAVESSDAIEPTCPDAHTILRYNENNLSAGIAYEGQYKTVVWGFPFECIREKKQREMLMREILDFFNPKKLNYE